MDGDIDYTRFSREQLQEALTRIDKSRYPRNYENLVREIGARPPEAPDEVAMVQPRGIGGRQRPTFVWLIIVFNVLSFVLMGLFVLLTVRYWSVFPESTKASVRSVSELAWITFAIAALLNLLGTIELFRMRRSGFYLIVGAFFVGLLEVVRSLFAGTTHLSIGGLFGWALSLLVCGYLWRLSRSGVLQ